MFLLHVFYFVYHCSNQFYLEFICYSRIFLTCHFYHINDLRESMKTKTCFLKKIESFGNWLESLTSGLLMSGELMIVNLQLSSNIP